MIAEIEVIQPGLFSTIQDRGRYGFLKFGVPVGGAMDKYAAKMANLLLQNSPDDPVMEITQMGPRLKFIKPTRIVICGAELSAKINDISILNGVPVKVKAGDILKFGRRQSGCRAYLGIAGGFLGSRVLGSKSWYEEITEHYRLEKGMKIHYRQIPSEAKVTHASIKIRSGYIQSNKVSVSPGPEFNLIPQQLTGDLFNRLYTIDRNNNRMAIQLTQFFINNLPSILTGPVIPGTVQLTPSGKIIILMRDCQTTGGYPRILQLSEDAINLLSQKIPGDKIRFIKSGEIA